jgi:GTP-binding protein HflX
MMLIPKEKLLKEEPKLLHWIAWTNQKIPTISIAGHTSAIKTTLISRLTIENKLVNLKLFTTISTAGYSVNSYNRKVIFSDSGDFISMLPAFS